MLSTACVKYVIYAPYGSRLCLIVGHKTGTEGAVNIWASVERCGYD